MNDLGKLSSFTVAGLLPIKLFHINPIIEGKIHPLHAQLNPTNVCNLKCPFCSCSEREKNLELSRSEAIGILCSLKKLGCRSLTITGGGEPMLYPHLNEVIDRAAILGISVGLVSNGLKIDDLEHPWPTWVRISFSDYRAADEGFFGKLRQAVHRLPSIDWGFSYILTRHPDYEKLAKILAFAAEEGFCHIRLVSDLLDLEAVPDMAEARARLSGLPGEELVIYQGRKEYNRGTKRCLISLLKPNIGADGYIYPCCGSQYALEEPSRDYSRDMSMGHWSNLERIIAEQRHFDGSVCGRCYYGAYNSVLEGMTAKLKHREFV